MFPFGVQIPLPEQSFKHPPCCIAVTFAGEDIVGAEEGILTLDGGLILVEGATLWEVAGD